MSIRIDELDFDSDNIDKLWAHGLHPVDIEFLVFESQAVTVVRNKRYHSAAYKLIGPDRSGGLITIAVVCVSRDDYIWRPITGWISTAGERTMWRKQWE